MKISYENRSKLIDLINKNVEIKLNSKQISPLKGYLINFDPITLTLLIYQAEKNQIQMIFDHTIKSIHLIEQCGEIDLKYRTFQEFCDNFFSNDPFESIYSEQNIETKADLEAKRQNLLRIFANNNVPVEEIDQTLIVAYYVCIDPPYTINDMKSSNMIVLDRIKSIIEQNK